MNENELITIATTVAPDVLTRPMERTLATMSAANVSMEDLNVIVDLMLQVAETPGACNDDNDASLCTALLPLLPVRWGHGSVIFNIVSDIASGNSNTLREASDNSEHAHAMSNSGDNSDSNSYNAINDASDAYSSISDMEGYGGNAFDRTDQDFRVVHTVGDGIDTLHSYLSDMSDVNLQCSSASTLTGTPGMVVRILLLPIRDVVVFPGDTLPLRLSAASTPEVVRRIRCVMSGSDVDAQGVGIVNLSLITGIRPKVASVGTLLRFLQANEVSKNELNALCRGQQRFRLVSPISSEDVLAASLTGYLVVNVRILNGDEELPKQLCFTGFHNPRFAYLCKINTCGFGGERAPFADRLPLSAPFSPWPNFVHAMCSPARIVKRILSLVSGSLAGLLPVPLLTRSRKEYGDFNLMTECGDESSDLTLLISPVELSYLVAKNMPKSPVVHTKQEYLEMDTVMDRLLAQSDDLQQLVDCPVVCSFCSSFPALTSVQNLISLSAEGCQGIFVNPHGSVHDMLTFSMARSDRISCLGEVTYENCWFRHFGWTITFCGTCGEHLGWLFTRNPTFNDRQSLNMFWGFRRAAVIALPCDSEHNDISDSDDEDELN